MMIRALLASSLVGLFVLAASTTASATDAQDQIACRAHSNASGTLELKLHWDGSSAKGTLEQTAPSGNVTTTPVKAERSDGMIIADNVFSTDLVSHAAVVKTSNGKRYMHTEETSSWLACE
jgi:hypothetical protein